jgi:uncharacterized protein
MIDRKGSALITGASRGIGREILLALWRRGYDCIAVGRDLPRLEALRSELDGERILVLPADLSQFQEIGRLISAVRSNTKAIDLLVNNAGLGEIGPFAEAAAERLLSMVQVNIWAVVALTREFLPEMVARGRGHVLNVASTAAFAPGPGMAVYYATKSFVLSFSEAVRVETRGQGVTVSALCPGATATDFDRTAGARGRRAAGSVGMEPRRVAERAVTGLLRGRRLIVPGTVNRLAIAVAQFAPRALSARITYRRNREK